MKLNIISNRTLIFGTLMTTFLTFAQQSPSLSSETDSSAIYTQNDINSSIDNENNDLKNSEKTKPTPPWFVKRFRVSAGLFIPVNDAKVEVGSQDGTLGTTIDFEDDLGFRKTTTTFLGELQWRASRRSQFSLSYFYLNRTTSHQLEKTIKFGDHTYPIEATVNSFFKTSIYRFSYGYAFFLSPKYELGLMVGAHILQTEVGIGLAGATASIGYSDKFDFTAPLPDLGIWGGYAFTDKFAFNGNISYLSLKINDIDGRIVSYNFSLMYEVLKNFDITLGYTGLNFKVDAEKEKLQGYLKWGYNGPSLSVSYAFGRR